MPVFDALDDWGAEVVIKGTHAGMTFKQLWESKPGILWKYINRSLTDTNMLSLRRYLIAKHYERGGTLVNAPSRRSKQKSDGTVACSLIKQKTVKNPLSQERRWCPQLDEDVWTWFLENRNTTRRDDIIRVANIMKKLMLDQWEMHHGPGTVHPKPSPKIPKVGAAWFRRWAKRYATREQVAHLRSPI